MKPQLKTKQQSIACMVEYRYDRKDQRRTCTVIDGRQRRYGRYGTVERNRSGRVSICAFCVIEQNSITVVTSGTDRLACFAFQVCKATRNLSIICRGTTQCFHFPICQQFIDNLVKVIKQFVGNDQFYFICAGIFEEIIQISLKK